MAPSSEGMNEHCEKERFRLVRDSRIDVYTVEFAMDNSILVKVTKGCPYLGISKGQVAALTFSAHPGYGVKAVGFPGQNVWMSGNQKHVPKITQGQVVNFNDGNPMHKITVQAC